MLNRNLLAILGIAALVSCNSIKSITASDASSGSTTTSKKKKNNSPVFLDNIVVTNSNTAKSTSHKSSTVSQKKPEQSVAITPAIIQTGLSTGEVENADFLQLKYAIMMNENVEALNNLDLLKNIESWYGTRYCMGGTSKSCIDCSAFSRAILQDVYNVALPRTAQDQYNSSRHISSNELKEGDLVFFSIGSRRISHVGVYLHNNKFVHASTSSGVMISDLDEKYWKRYYKGSGRVVN